MNRLVEFFEERTGGLSMTRLTIAVIVVAYIGWGSYIVWQTRTIPDLPVQVTLLLVGLYGFNKSSINIGQSRQDPQTEPPTQ